MRAVLVIAAVAAACAAGRDGAAENTTRTYLCHVAQPVVSRDDSRVQTHYVTYALMLQSPVPGIEVLYTCQPGAVVVRPQAWSDTAQRAETVNLNAANLLGIRVTIMKRPMGTWNSEADSTTPQTQAKSRTRFYVDELKAVLDVGSLAKRQSSKTSPDRYNLSQYDALVEATVACILENAAHSRPPIRNLKLDVVGWDRYRRYSNRYPIPTPVPRKEFGY